MAIDRPFLKNNLNFINLRGIRLRSTQIFDITFSSNQDDLDLGLGSRYRITPTIDATISGIISFGIDGRDIEIINTSALNLTLAHEGAGSTARYRFFAESGADLVILPNQSAILFYDLTLTRWRVRLGTSGGLTGIPTVQTADATPTVIFSETIPDPAVCTYQVFVSGRKTDGSETASYIRTAKVSRSGGSAVLGIVQADYTDESNALFDCTFTVSGNDIEVTVTGLAGSDIDWKGGIQKVCVP